MRNESTIDESHALVSEETSPRTKTVVASLRRRYDHISRFIGSWVGFSGLYALAGGTCPCCGRPNCPVGLTGMGVVGGVLAAGFQAWRRLQR